MSKIIVVTDKGTRYHRKAKILFLDSGEYQLLTSGHLSLSQVYPIEEFTLEDLQVEVNRRQEEEDDTDGEMDDTVQVSAGDFNFTLSPLVGGVFIQVSHADEGGIRMSTFLPNGGA